MQLFYLILVVYSSILFFYPREVNPKPLVTQSAPESTTSTPYKGPDETGLSLEVFNRVMKYRQFFTQEICFNFGCSKAAIFFAQVHQESRWVDTAQSKYASGIAQFTPDTAEWINQLYAKDLKELCPAATGCPLDPKWALRSLTLYMKKLHTSYALAQTEDDRFGFSLAAYNGGAGWISKEQKKAEAEHFNPNLWFGGVEITCVRAEWACKENREYPDIILHKWKPMYLKLLGG
jgi:hypothetical protein